MVISLGLVPTPKDLGVGLLIGGVCIFIVMMFFGAMGMIAYAKDATSYDNFSKFAYLSFFDLLEPLSEFSHIVALILVTTFCASSVDTRDQGWGWGFSRKDAQTLAQ